MTTPMDSLDDQVQAQCCGWIEVEIFPPVLRNSVIKRKRTSLGGQTIAIVCPVRISFPQRIRTRALAHSAGSSITGKPAEAPNRYHEPCGAPGDEYPEICPVGPRSQCVGVVGREKEIG